MIEVLTTLTTSGRRYHNLSDSSSVNNMTVYLQPVIAALRMIQKSICECCGRIGNKANACIIRVPKTLPSSLLNKDEVVQLTSLRRIK